MGTADYDVLLDNLRQLISAPGNAEFTRPNLIALLEVLVTHLGDALVTTAGELEDRTLVQVEHPVATQLSGLASALRDLDAGLTDPVLKSTTSKKTARRPWSLREEDQILLEAVEVFRRFKRIPSLTEAARKVTTALNRHNYTRRGKRLKGKDLYNLINRYN